MEPVAIPSIEDDKEPVINVIMKITFVILLLTLIGGLGYIFITSNKKPTTKITPTKVSTRTSPVSLTISPTKVEFIGKIIEMNTHTISPIPGFDNIGLSFKLEINEGATKKPQLFFFEKNELNKLQIIDFVGKIISYEDLQVGQNIKLLRIYDLEKSSYSNIEINIID
ncbi:MAG: hypothetical protein ACD_12C00759G0006 [uncultured bacterium]|nr:MAG: hypothetical protein ACD_12C00759G0006 [uncultured bacterium]